MTDSKNSEKKPNQAEVEKSPAKNTDSQETKVKKTNGEKKSTAKKSGSSAGVIAFLALIIAIAACGAAWWLWQQVQLSKQTLGTELNTNNESTQTEIRKIMNEVNHINTDLDGKITQQNQQLDTLQENISKAQTETEQVAETLTTLHSKLNINPKIGWLVAEAEYLLSIANQQLLLTTNIDSSIAALRNADQRLRETGDPGLLDIRSLIADEVTQLQSVVVVDVAGAALTLASLQTRVDELSLAGFDSVEIESNEKDESIEDKAQEDSNQFSQGLNTAWQSIKDLLAIKVRERGDSSTGNPLLTPDQRALIYQNLRLKLESARLSLVQRDAVTYKQSLEISKDWLRSYFDEDNKRSALIETLEELESISLKFSPPDISGSLDALRLWQRQQNNRGE